MKALLLILFAVLLIGCVNGTRLVSGLGVGATTTIDPLTGQPVVSGSFNIQFRDGRDSKTIRQPRIQ